MDKASIITLLFLFIGPVIHGQTASGTITDKTTGEPLIGVTVQVQGTTIGTVTDFNGFFEISKLPEGELRLIVSYVSYKPITSEPLKLKLGESISINFFMEEDNMLLDEVVVTARRNMENENILIIERINSNIAIENLGAKEMGLKGISNVADGVQKISGIALADAGQIYVRGLGDRYNSTSLNGLSIASPNPDNKLIPLDLFPSSTVKNITVGKVYQAAYFADYSGAHIDISTRDNFDDDYLSVSLGTGGMVNTLGKSFYGIDNGSNILLSNNLPESVKNMTSREFSQYIKTNDIFGTTFSAVKSTAVPDIGGTIGLGKSWKIGSNKLNLLASLGADNGKSTIKGGYTSTLNTQGEKLNEFSYDSYSNEFKLAALMSLNYSFGESDKLGYVMFYTRNTTDELKIRQGYDSEGIDLIGINSVSHTYSLLNNQISGQHSYGDKLSINWSGSYGITGSDEPDRRQVMYRIDEGVLSLFKLNKQETMRYFGELNESEAVGEANLLYELSDKNKLRFGGAYKHKERNFTSTRFYYNLNNIDEQVDNILETESFLGYENIKNGSVAILKDFQPRSQYFAGNDIWAVYSEADYSPFDKFLINVGLRYENSKQWVRYWTDASIEKLSKLNTADLFPSINLKYDFNSSNIRFSASRTVTRPLFIEIAPFLYKESYGSDEIRGNNNLKNGYNFNFDLKYELYSDNNKDLYSIALYYKHLNNPIERVQESSGGSSVHSFRNASDGLAFGSEMEIKKDLLDVLRIGANIALMYTNIVLPEGSGIYTEQNRALQGASPYLVNADISYNPVLGSKTKATVTLVYNLQGPRIYAVGIYGMSDVIQEPINTLNLVSELNLGNNKSIKLQFKNLLDSELKYTQKIINTGEKAIVQSHREGLSIDLGFSYKF